VSKMLQEIETRAETGTAMVGNQGNELIELTV